MYHRILIPLENSPADETILAHIKPLARLTKAELLLLHVADGGPLPEPPEGQGARAQLVVGLGRGRLRLSWPPAMAHCGA